MLEDAQLCEGRGQRRPSSCGSSATGGSRSPMLEEAQLCEGRGRVAILGTEEEQQRADNCPGGDGGGDCGGGEA